VPTQNIVFPASIYDLPVRRFPISTCEDSVREFAASTAFALRQYLVFAYQAVAWYTAPMQLFTRWMWIDSSWSIERSRRLWKCNKKTNSFCGVIKGRKSSTCGPREISISFPGNLHFFKP